MILASSGNIMNQKQLVLCLEAQNSHKPVKEECDVLEMEDDDLSKNKEIDESKYDLIDDTKMFHSEEYESKCLQHTTLVESELLGMSISPGCDEMIKKETNLSEDEAGDSKCLIQQYLDEEGKLCNNIDTIHLKKEGISECLQHCELDTVKSEHSDFGLQSGCVERMNGNSEVSQEKIEDSKYFIQQYLDNGEKLWDCIETASSKKMETIECSQHTTLVESAQLGISIQSGCDEIMNRETNESETEDNKCFIHQYLDEEGKLHNNIETMYSKKDGAARELLENELLVKDDVKGNTCKCYVDEYSTRRNNVNRYAFDIHQKIYKCPMCEYVTESNLKLHIDTVHLKVKEQTEKKHKCYLCQHSTVKRLDLNHHMDSVHHIVKREKIHECHLCQYRTAKISNLYRHIKGVHLKVKREKKHRCDLCEYSTAKNCDLNRHIRGVHLKVKPFKCHLCDFSSVTNGNLKYHIDSVHLRVKRRKKHKCHLCEYRTAFIRHLKRHIGNTVMKTKVSPLQLQCS